MTRQMRSSVIFHVACAAAVLLATADARVWAAQQLPQNLIVNRTPSPVASIEFEDQGGKTRNLGDFKGKIIVLNIWATWCVPCRKEMPTLDHLQAALGGPDFEVVPVSIDLGGIVAVRKFYADIGVLNLSIYVDISGRATHQIGAFGVPTTLILDRDREEIARAVGPAEWDSPEIMQFLRSVIAQRHTTTGVAETRQVSSGVLQRGLQWLRTLVGN